MEDDSIRGWTTTLRIEEQVSILATLIHANNNKCLTEDIVRFAMALGARGMVCLQSRHIDESTIKRLQDLMSEGVLWRR